MTSSIRRNILARLIESGFQITPEALEYLVDLKFPMATVESKILVKNPAEAPSVLSKEYVESLIEGHEVEPEVLESPPVVHDDPPEPLPDSEPETSTSGWDFRIEKSPSDESVGSEGTIDDFLEMFRDRFERIKKIYMARIDTQNAVPPSVAKIRKNPARRSGP
ncbi:MAG: hypothetical protein ACFFEV_02665, partial [Candidatus Thorarchaeota archaeon]